MSWVKTTPIVPGTVLYIVLLTDFKVILEMEAYHSNSAKSLIYYFSIV